MENITTLPNDNTSFQGNHDSSFNISSDNHSLDIQIDEDTIAFYYTLWTIVTPMLFALIIVIGTAGNVLVIYVILSRPAMQTATNYLLINLAFSDMAFLLICVPVTAYKFAATTWPFGDATCKVITYVIYVTVYVTVYTLVAVSLLRYLTVVHSTTTSQYRTKKTVIGLNLLIWIVVLTVNIPTLLTHQLKVFDEYYAYCGIVGNNIKGFFLSFFLAGYLIPLTVICFLYINIIVHLRKASTSTIGQTRRRTTRALKVISLVVVVFALSWLPLHVNQLWSSFSHIPPGKVYEVFRILTNCMAYGNSCANPIIYNFVSSDFRNPFKEVIFCKKRSSLRLRNETVTTNNSEETTKRTTLM